MQMPVYRTGKYLSKDRLFEEYKFSPPPRRPHHSKLSKFIRPFSFFEYMQVVYLYLQIPYKTLLISILLTVNGCDLLYNRKLIGWFLYYDLRLSTPSPLTPISPTPTPTETCFEFFTSLNCLHMVINFLTSSQPIGFCAIQMFLLFCKLRVPPLFANRNMIRFYLSQ